MSRDNGRYIGPDELSLNEALANLGNSKWALVYVLLKTHADDQGRLEITSPRVLKAQIAPLFDDISARDIGEAIQAMAAVNLVICYEADGRDLLQIVQWRNTRRWRYPSAYPPPAGWTDDVHTSKDEEANEESEESDDFERSEAEKVEQEDDIERFCGNLPQSAAGCSSLRIGEGDGVGVGDGVGDGGDGALAPPAAPQRRSKRKKPPDNASPPRPAAADVYRGVTGRYPHRAVWERLARVSDLDRWRRVVQSYIACGWNPGNVGAMLDYYDRNETPRTGRREKTARRAGLVDEAAYEEQFRQAKARGLVEET